MGWLEFCVEIVLTRSCLLSDCFDDRDLIDRFRYCIVVCLTLCVCVVAFAFGSWDR